MTTTAMSGKRETKVILSGLLDFNSDEKLTLAGTILMKYRLSDLNEFRIG